MALTDSQLVVLQQLTQMQRLLDSDASTGPAFDDLVALRDQYLDDLVVASMDAQDREWRDLGQWVIEHVEANPSMRGLDVRSWLADAIKEYPVAASMEFAKLGRELHDTAQENPAFKGRGWFREALSFLENFGKPLAPEVLISTENEAKRRAIDRIWPAVRDNPHLAGIDWAMWAANKLHHYRGPASEPLTLDPQLAQFYNVSNDADLIKAMEHHILKLQEKVLPSAVDHMHLPPRQG